MRAGALPRSARQRHAPGENELAKDARQCLSTSESTCTASGPRWRRTSGRARILNQSYLHEHRRQLPNLFAMRPDALGPPRLTHFSGAHAGVIGAVRAAHGTHTARRKTGKDSRQRLRPNADGTNER